MFYNYFLFGKLIMTRNNELSISIISKQFVLWNKIPPKAISEMGLNDISTIREL